MLLHNNNRSYAIGLTWSVEPTKAKIRERLKEAPGASYVRVDKHSKDADAHLGLFKGRIKGTVYSAALAIATVEPSCIVYESIADDTVWVCVLVNGLPLPGLDTLVRPEEGQKILHDHIAHAEVIIGDEAGSKSTVADVLDRFDAYLASKQLSRKQLDSITLKNQPRLIVRLMLAAGLAAGAVAVAGGLAYVNHLREQNRLNELNLQRIAQSAEEAESERLARERRIQQFRDQVQQQREALSSAVGVAALRWNQWEDLRRSLPVSNFGYRPDTLECTESACTLTWVSGGNLTRGTDRRLLPAVVNSDALEVAPQSRFPMVPVVGSRGGGDYGTVSDLRFAILRATEISVPNVLVGAPVPKTLQAPAELKLPPETIGEVGKIAASFNGIAAAVHAADAIGVLRAAPVILKSAKWRALSSTSPTVDLEAEYVFVASRM